MANVGQQTDNMVTLGGLPDTGVVVPGGSAPREQQINRLDALAANFAIGHGIKPANVQAVMADAVDASNGIIASLPGNGAQQVFSDAMAKFLRENPGVTGDVFARILQGQFRLDPAAATLSTDLERDGALVRDTRARTSDNPSGLVASASLQIPTSPEEVRHQAALETGANIAALGMNANFEIRATITEMVEDMKADGFLAGVPDLPPRDRPQNPFSPEQSKTMLSGLMRSYYGASMSDSTLTSALTSADTLAFNVSGRDMGPGFNAAVDRLTASNPNMDRGLAVELMAHALNVVTQSTDFSVSRRGNAINLDFLNDRRLATAANPEGRAVMVMEDSSREIDGPGIFRVGREMATAIQQGAAKLGPTATPSDIAQFVQDIQDNLFALRFDQDVH
jgi:hypothetical protein